KRGEARGDRCSGAMDLGPRALRREVLCSGKRSMALKGPFCITKNVLSLALTLMHACESPPVFRNRFDQASKDMLRASLEPDGRFESDAEAGDRGAGCPAIRRA